MDPSDAVYDDAITLQQKGDLDGAVAKLQSLLAQDADYALAHAALSVFLSRANRHEEAIEHARRVCDLEPADPFSFIAMSLLCQKAGRIPEAERAMAQAHHAQMASRESSS
jgi:predicted Zn-dependent protease